jgi:hypothetical protein
MFLLKDAVKLRNSCMSRTTALLNNNYHLQNKYISPPIKNRVIAGKTNCFTAFFVGGRNNSL